MCKKVREATRPYYVEVDTKVEKHIAKGSYSMINIVAVSHNDSLFTRYSILLRVWSKKNESWL